MGLARSVAAQWVRRGVPAALDFDELVGEACLALVVEARRFKDEQRWWNYHARRAINVAIARRCRLEYRAERAVRLDAPQQDGDDAPGMEIPDERAECPQRAAEARWQHRALRRAVAHLPGFGPWTVGLCCLGGLTQAEAARRIGVSQSAVTQSIRAALPRLARMLT